MAKLTDTSAAPSFAAVSQDYASLQKQAYATQDVKTATITSFAQSLDTFISENVTDADKASQLLAQADKTLASMAHTADIQQTSGATNNAGWDADREAMEALLNQLAPEGADAVFSPVADTNPLQGVEDPQTDTTTGETHETPTDPVQAEPEETDPSATLPSEAPTQAPDVNDAMPMASDESGTGWGNADLLDPKSTATYKGLSLDAMLAMPDSLVAKEIGNQPDIVAAIRKVSSESSVPSGLLAAMIIQESNGDRTTTSDNPGYGGQPADQQKDVGIIQSPLWQFDGATTAEKLKNAQDPYTNLKVFAQEASQTYKDTGSWGQVAQVWYTGDVADRLGGVTGGASEETNYVLNVFSNLGMGASTYYPKDGF